MATTTVQLRRGTSAQWAAANPILDSGELGLDTTERALKVGDGSTAWNSLEWLNYKDVAPFAISDVTGLQTELDTIDAPRWDDLRFPAQGINPPGAVGTASRIETDSSTAWTGCLSFSGTQDNMIAGVAQMPHAWIEQSAIKPHIHWLKTTGSSSAVAWEFYYRWLGNVAATADAEWSGPVTGTLVAGDQTVAEDHLLTSFGELDTTGKRDSAVLAWKIYRRGSSDADNNAVVLVEFDIHYQSDGRGSVDEYPDLT